MRIDGGKIVSPDSPASESSPARDSVRRVFAGVTAALEACEVELGKVEAKAQAKADQIVADAQRLSDEVKKNSEGLVDLMAKSKKELGLL
jgi:regulator of protease activity HflC (stomatin/prohibitin superfamily)